MQAYQPITAVAGYTESYTRHAPSNQRLKSGKKKCLLFWNYDYFWPKKTY